MSSIYCIQLSRLGRSFFALLLFLFLLPAITIAAQVTVAWDPNDPTPDGYRLFQRMEGQGYDYDQPVWAGTDTTATIAGLVEDQYYYFVVRAYTGSYESGDSNEITFLAESSQPDVTTYSIAVSLGQNGSISPDQAVTVTAGSSQSFSIAPDAGYHIDDVLIDGNSVGAVSSYTFSQVSANHTIQPVFGINRYTIAASAGANGTISPTGNVDAEYGADQTFTFTTDAGYHVSDVKVDGISKGSLASYSFTQITGDHTIAVDFSKDTYTIPQTTEVTLAWDPNDPLPDFYCLFMRTEGQDYNYEQPYWSGSGTSTTVYNLDYDTTYYFVVRAQVGSSQSSDSNEISFRGASPVSDTYTIASSAETNGSISPSGLTEINSGDNQIYTIVPDAGYHVSDVIVDGTSVGAVSNYLFGAISADHTISASFAIDTFTLTASAGSNGSIDPAGTMLVDRGASRTFTITADTGYHVSDVLVNGSSVGAVSSYTFSNITSNHGINAMFAADTFIISTAVNANGAVAPANSVSVEYGGSQTFTFAADNGYHIEDIQVDGQSIGVCQTHTFTDVSADHTLNVVFAETTPVELWLEAEDGDLQWPMEIADDENASAGGYVWVPEGAGSHYSVSESAGYAEYTFDLPESGEYVIWGRQVSNSGSSDSFFVSVDGQPEIVWHTRRSGENQWTWDGVSIRDAASPDYESVPERFLLSAGPHTLKILQREDGTKLDKLLITNLTDMTDPDPEPDTVLEDIEFGEIKINHEWLWVDFNKTFNKPVVVAGPISLNGGSPAVIRIKNVESTGFRIRIQEWAYLDDSHAFEKVSYLVMEAGTYTLNDGTRVEAKNVKPEASSSFQTIDFIEEFNTKPVVMASLTSHHDAEPVTRQIKEITTTGFMFRMKEQQSNIQDHLSETLSYIAWEPSLGSIGGIYYDVGRTANKVRHKIYSLAFDAPFASPPIFLAGMQTTDGGDTANVRCQNKTVDAVEVFIDEEQSKDSETNHTTEVVGFISLVGESL